MNGLASLSRWDEQLKVFQEQDTARYAFLEGLARNYQELTTKYSEKCEDFNNEIESRRMWQKKAKDLTEQRQSSESNSFALAILDGDGAIFEDYLYAMGKEGGLEAGHRLHTEIKNQLKATYPEMPTDDWRVVVQIVLNLQGLAATLVQSGIVKSLSEVFEFGRGFGQAQPLFSFIDVGAGKERADHKIKETLRVFLPNTQCKHVFFGPCSDKGYTPFLESYKKDYANRLTLIETRPAEPDFVNLGFAIIRIPSIFRSSNLPPKPTGIAHPTTTAPPGRSNSVTQVQPNVALVVPKSPSPKGLRKALHLRLGLLWANLAPKVSILRHKNQLDVATFF